MKTAWPDEHADKQVFPDLDVVGWYTTGPEIRPTDMDIHRLVSCASCAWDQWSHAPHPACLS